MADREYKIADLPRGQRGQEVIEITPDGQSSLLWLPPEVPSETKFDFLGALRQAYQAGREDGALAERLRHSNLTREQILEKYAPPRPWGDR